METKTIEERLAEQLDAKDEEIGELESRISELEERLDGVRGAWAMHRKIDDDHPGLPVPRLEFAWTPSAHGWCEFVAEYRLVYRHLLDHLVAVPLGQTKTSSSAGQSPWAHDADLSNPRRWLPFRDGCHAVHDAKHMALPLFAHGPAGPVRIDPRSDEETR